ncbi:MAG: response regulator [Candidatus Dojkabacteria bacterium]
MDTANISKKIILLIDDDINIRLVVKKLLNSHLINSEVYTSDKGPDGLGLSYILKPNIIILDTTLPKYSGREIVDYIMTNNIFLNTKVVILHEDVEISNFTNLGPNYYALSKKVTDFPEALIRFIEQDVEHKDDNRTFRLALSIGKTVIFFANSSDTNIRDFETIGAILPRIYSLVSFAISQLLTSINLSLFFLLMGREDTEEDLSGNKDEFSAYRSSIYSRFILTVSALVIIAIVIILISLS